MNREDMIQAIAHDDANLLATWAISGPYDEIVQYVRLHVLEGMTDEELAVEYTERWPTYCIVCGQQIDPDGRQEECIICGNGPICGLCWISGSRCLACEDEEVETCPECGEPTDDQDDYGWWTCSNCEVTWQKGEA